MPGAAGTVRAYPGALDGCSDGQGDGTFAALKPVDRPEKCSKECEKRSVRTLASGSATLYDDGNRKMMDSRASVREREGYNRRKISGPENQRFVGSFLLEHGQFRNGLGNSTRRGVRKTGLG
jgi:hypothetical protein